STSRNRTFSACCAGLLSLLSSQPRTLPTEISCDVDGASTVLLPRVLVATSPPLTWARTYCSVAATTVPIENSELHENMEFGYPPSSLLPGAQRTSFVDCRHGDDLQISNRPPGGKHRSAPSTRGAPPLGEAA